MTPTGPSQTIVVLYPWLFVGQSRGLLRINLLHVDNICSSDDRKSLILARAGIEVGIDMNPPDLEEVMRRVGARTSGLQPGEEAVLVVVGSDTAASSTPLTGVVFGMTRGRHTIGRDKASSIQLGHSSISRTHAVVTYDETHDGFIIVDRHSSNGLRINGSRCISAVLANGDLVDVGHVRLLFLDRRALRSPADTVLDDVISLDGSPITADARHIHIGDRSLPLAAVVEAARAGESIALAEDQQVQAALLLLACTPPSQ